MTNCSDGDSFRVVADINYVYLEYGVFSSPDGCYGALDCQVTGEESEDHFCTGGEYSTYEYYFRTYTFDDVEVWVFASYYNGTYNPRCRDYYDNDYSTLHPTEVLYWACENSDGEFTLFPEFVTTCGCSTPAPTTTPELTSAPAATSEPSATPTTPVSLASDGSGGATTVVVVVGTLVAGALAVAALVFYLRRRRVAKKKDVNPPAPHPDSSAGDLEHGREHRQEWDGKSPTSIGVAGGNGVSDPSSQQRGPPPPYSDTYSRNALPTPNQHAAAVVAAETNNDDCGRAQSLSTAPLAGAAMSRTDQTAYQGKGIGRAPAGRGTGDWSSAQQLLLTATNSTAGLTTEARTELAVGEISAEEDADLPADGPTTASRESAASSIAAGRRTPCDIGCGQAAMVAAQQLAHNCQIPGVSEAVTVVSMLIQLVSNSKDDVSRVDARLRRCRSIVMMLERAAKVLGKGGDTNGEVERVLVEDVHDAVCDLVELIKAYESKNKMSKVLTSTLFKRRLDELDAVVDRAILRLHLGLQVQVGHNVKEGLYLHKTSTAKAEAETLARARSARRQRKLNQVEIPEDHVTVTDELLGKGGFGEVYLADYNGHNAAAKVQHFTHGFGRLSQDDALDGARKGQPDAQREKSLRKAFLRELDAMIRLRSPHTVNVYGAITSLPDRLILVMELLVGGDLRNMLKTSEQPLPEEQSRQIIGDICAGMTFLHSKGTVHGDLKSANILLDARGRAKIGDFGTSRWTQNTERSTGLAAYTTKPGASTHISFAWTAPEVLETNGTSNASDVYSYGMVVWEVLSRKTPWADQALPRDIYLRVVIRGERPVIPDDAPADIAEMLLGCWAQAPQERPTFQALMDGVMSDRRR